MVMSTAILENGTTTTKKQESVRKGKILSFLTFHNAPVINFIKMCKPYAVPPKRAYEAYWLNSLS